jgi:hypothetical protein
VLLTEIPHYVRDDLRGAEQLHLQL